jgi:methyl-accepting chemotaxis protein
VKSLISEEQRLLVQTKEQFTTLDSEIASSVDNINAVADITERLNEIKDVVSSAVADLSAISEETSATNEEITASAAVVATNVSNLSTSMADITKLADDLNEAISFFKA